MAVQISGRQIKNNAVGVGKLDLSTGTFDFTSAVLQVATPSADSHAATKAYVDSIAQGLHWKDSVRVATTANITLSGAQTIDGVSVVAGDRVLVKNQTDAKDNGIYVAASGSWARSSDMDASSEFSGAAVFIQEGTVNGDTGYVCTNDGDVTVGSTSITFTQFTGAGQLTGGDGIDITGSTISVNVDDSSIEIASDALQVKALGITNAMLAGSIANAKLANSTISGVALGNNLGSLSASAAGAITLTSYNGSAAVSDLAVNVDDSSIEIASNSLQVKSGGITNAMLAGSIAAAKLAGSIPADKLNLGNGLLDSAGNLQIDLDGATLALGANGIKVADDGIGNAQIADDAVQTENLNFAGFFSAFDADGSTAAFEMQSALDLEFQQFFVVTVNGLVVEYKDTPDGQDNYKIANDGTGGVAKITFGANLANGDRVTIRGFVNN